MCARTRVPALGRAIRTALLLLLSAITSLLIELMNSPAKGFWFDWVRSLPAAWRLIGLRAVAMHQSKVTEELYSITRRRRKRHKDIQRIEPNTLRSLGLPFPLEGNQTHSLSHTPARPESDLNILYSMLFSPSFPFSSHWFCLPPFFQNKNKTKRIFSFFFSSYFLGYSPHALQ